MNEKKIFVLDTNVILHDKKCIFNFKEHDIVIPTIVLEELDKFKKGNEELNHHAREFSRIMDKFRKKKEVKPGEENKLIAALPNGGVSLGPDKGLIQVKSTGIIPEEVKSIYFEDTPDNRILGLVLKLSQDETVKRQVILITKDINLRIKADVIGLEAEDYKNDKVSFEGYLGRATVKYPAKKITDIFKTNQQDVDPSLIKFYPDGIPENMYFILDGKSNSALARYSEKKLICVEKQNVFGIKPRNSEQTFSVDALRLEQVKLVCLSGKAGTGKTLLAIAAGLDCLKNQMCDQIIIAAATVPLGNKEIGFLPGDAQEKVSPYMQGLFDNLAFIKRQMSLKDREWVESAQKDGRILIQPLASIRGRSLNDTFFIIDESQNLNPHEAKTIVTRAGQNTKVVFCGDVTQIDSPYLDAYSNGLSHVVAKMTGQPMFAHIALEKGERSPLAELAATLL
ncbi:TPA: PhoH family protein [Patescibacteria group bacterium]|nr:hypothetical protein P148_SR1C00001G0355 [candidate division SR1 bacterium RAAC1_SR1_1]HCY20781.1 PhoH family protein [Candidatus Gracilibacteria bacterium]